MGAPDVFLTLEQVELLHQLADISFVEACQYAVLHGDVLSKGIDSLANNAFVSLREASILPSHAY